MRNFVHLIQYEQGPFSFGAVGQQPRLFPLRFDPSGSAQGRLVGAGNVIGQLLRSATCKARVVLPTCLAPETT